MGSFDQSKAYAAQEQEGTFFDDGREIDLLHFVYSHPNIESIRGSPEKVLAAIDEYGRTKKYLMNVGEDKGRIVTDLIAEVKPKTMVGNRSVEAATTVCSKLILVSGRTWRLRWLLMYSLRQRSTQCRWRAIFQFGTRSCIRSGYHVTRRSCRSLRSGQSHCRLER